MITLTNRFGKKVYVNEKKILQFYESLDFTVVEIAGNKSIVVKESSKDVYAKILMSKE